MTDEFSLNGILRIYADPYKNAQICCSKKSLSDELIVGVGFNPRITLGLTFPVALATDELFVSGKLRIVF